LGIISDWKHVITSYNISLYRQQLFVSRPILVSKTPQNIDGSRSTLSSTHCCHTTSSSSIPTPGTENNQLSPAIMYAHLAFPPRFTGKIIFHFFFYCLIFDLFQANKKENQASTSNYKKTFLWNNWENWFVIFIFVST